MNLRLPTTLWALVALLSMPGLALTQVVDLSPRFEIDQAHRFRVTSDSVVTRSIPDLDQEISQTTTLTYYLTRLIKEINGEQIRAELRFDRIVLKTQAPNLLGEFEDVIYDTGLRDPETGMVQGKANLGRGEFVAQQYAEVLDPLLGNAIKITLDRTGKINGVDIPEAFGDAELFSTEMIRDRFLPLFQVHPGGGPIEIGAQWEQTSEQDSGLGFDVMALTRWTLESHESEQATMTVRNEFSTGEVRRDTGITLRDSAGSGSVVWNTRLGVLESLTSRQAVRMAGIPKGMASGPVELRVRSLLEIERSEHPWSLEDLPANEVDPQAPAPE